MKILLTGASGYLGSILVAKLLNLGHEVALLLRQESKLDRLGRLTERCVVGRVADDKSINSFLVNFQPDMVVHAACSYGRKQEALSHISDANYRLGLVILESLLSAPQKTTFINIGTALDSEVNFYTFTKNQFSKCGKVLSDASRGKLAFVNVRLQHFYGPDGDDSNFISYVLNSCLAEVPVLKLTKGMQLRDFIFIDDAIRALLVIVNNKNKYKAYEDIDVGTGEVIKIRDIVEEILRLTKSKTKLDFGALPYREMESMYSCANIERMKQMGWSPLYKIKDGLSRMIAIHGDKYHASHTMP